MVIKIWKWFLQGMALVAPVALTIALLAWLGSWFEQTLGGLIKTVVPSAWYFEGLGLIIGILSTLAIGLAANLFLVRWLVGLFDTVLERIPLETTLYQALKDIARLFSQDVDKQLGHAVAVDLAGTRVVGFMMQRRAELPGSFDDDEDRVAVYIAMSFQLGGFTIYVPRSSVTPLDVPPDQAIRAVLTGGSLRTEHSKPEAAE